MKIVRLLALAALVSLWASAVQAQVPQLLNYQGRITVGGTNFDGSGQFKFALVSAGGAISYWSNDGTSSGGSAPTSAVSLPVTRGLYSVQLGDTTLAGMSVLPASVFNNASVWLRVWFDDGVNGFQLLSPDQRIAAVGYALMAGNVPDGLVTTAKLADGAVTSAKLGGSAIGNAQLASSAVTGVKIADGTISASKLNFTPLTSESDPQVGPITSNYVPKWNGMALVTGTIFDNGNIGIGRSSPSAKLDVGGAIAIHGTTVINSSGQWVGPGMGGPTSAVCGNNVGSISCASICSRGVVTQFYADSNGETCTASSSTGSCSAGYQITPSSRIGYCCVCRQ